jgi:hypothetical protein
MRSGVKRVIVVMIFAAASTIFIAKPIAELIMPKFEIKISVEALTGQDQLPNIGKVDPRRTAADSGQPSLLRTNVRVVKVVRVGPDGLVDLRPYRRGEVDEELQNGAQPGGAR